MTCSFTLLHYWLRSCKEPLSVLESHRYIEPIHQLFTVIDILTNVIPIISIATRSFLWKFAYYSYYLLIYINCSFCIYYQHHVLCNTCQWSVSSFFVDLFFCVVFIWKVGTNDNFDTDWKEMMQHNKPSIISFYFFSCSLLLHLWLWHINIFMHRQGWLVILVSWPLCIMIIMILYDPIWPQIFHRQPQSQTKFCPEKVMTRPK